MAYTSGDVADRANAAGPVIRGYLIESFLLGDDTGFDDDESLLDSGIIDSTGVMEVVAFLEEHFSIAVDDEELIADNLDSVNRLARFVAHKLAAGSNGAG